jgi:hypothetical protein
MNSTAPWLKLADHSSITLDYANTQVASKRDRQQHG